MGLPFHSLAYFSVPTHLLVLNLPLAFDIYINSSAIEGRERFIKIVKQGDFLSEEQLREFRTKYRTLYLLESQRGLFLQSLMQLPGKDPEEKLRFVKESAVLYLSRIFETAPSTELLGKTLADSREVVETLVDLIRGNDLDSVKKLLANLGSHDFYTYDHSINVAVYSIMIVQSIHPNAKREELVHAGLSGLFHDLGKINIPVGILNKPDKLTAEELGVMQRHPELGSELLLQPSLVIPEGIDAGQVRRSVLEHHENFDGSGYPFRLQGEAIHFFARVTAVADFFDAVTTKRAYAPAITPEQALALMKRSEGKKLDPRIFQCFCKHTEGYYRSLHSNIELPSSFDPCQPQSQFPFVLVKADPKKAAAKIRFIADADRRSAKTGLLKKKVA